MPMPQSTISNQFSATGSRGHSGAYLQQCHASWNGQLGEGGVGDDCLHDLVTKMLGFEKFAARGAIRV